MIPMTLRQIAEVTGGHGEPAVADLVVWAPPEVDSRLSTEGSLFAAVVGERVDGHDFAADAAARGARAALVTRPVHSPSCVVVPDVIEALGRLAAHVLEQLRRDGGPRVIGVTGSSGKTSTKDLLAQVLLLAGETVAPVGSFNNEIGLPLTVLRATPATRHLVLEMSARGIGHIAALCAVAPVDVGAVLNIGSAHVGEFGSREAIATAKAELLAGIRTGGVAVLNADDPIVAAMRPPGHVRVVTFGRAPSADVRAADVTLDDTGRPSFRLLTRRGDAPVRMQLVGEHQVGNALAAAAVALESDLEVPAIAAALSAAVALSRWRMEIRQTADGVTVINDSYNANPESMRAALAALVRLGQGRRTWAVLGPMAELGDVTQQEHELLGRQCAALGVDQVVAVGDAAAIEEAASAAGASARLCVDVDEAVQLLRRELMPGDVVLVKASRSAGLERIADAIAPGRPGGAA